MSPYKYLIALLLVVLMSWAVPRNDYYLRGTFLIGNHLPLGAVFLLTLLVMVINPLLRRVHEKLVFNRKESLLLWCILIVCSGIPSSGFSRYFYSTLVAPAYYASSQNQWNKKLLPFIDERLVPSRDGKSDVVRQFFEKKPEDAPIPWHLWKGPLLRWSVFMVCLCTMTWCLSAMLRKQWMEIERLNYPLVVLPLALIEPPENGKWVNSFLRNPSTWVGITIPVFIHLVNGLRKWHPEIPEIVLRFQLRPLLREAPWSEMTFDSMFIYLSVVAFMILVPLEVSLSLWFFYIFQQFEYVVAYLIGYPAGGNSMPFSVYQQAGAFLVLAGVLLWRARHHLRNVFRKAVFDAPDVDDSREVMSYRAAIIGLVASLVAGAGWCAEYGMSFWYSLAGLLLWLAILLCLSRLITQGGMLFVYQRFSPVEILDAAFGASRLGKTTSATMALQNIYFIHDARESLMPSTFNAVRINDESDYPRSLGWLVMPALVLTFVCSGYFFVSQAYEVGGANLDWFGMRAVFGWKLNPWVRTLYAGESTNWYNVGYMSWGALLMGFVSHMSGSYHWWPIHPLGMLMSNSYAMRHFWFSIFLGWAIKFAILRYGGARTYRERIPFFLGMVVGECFIGGIWVIVGFVTETPTNFQILPT
ncbi:MAG: hypothetical protein O3B01_16695 [Planctomycetota bacterium]|nr:hypothetical protein [Planctomycetota bacterium]MDA1140215.1 hypothetical protein [Planctomycetota bacterium]